MAKAKEKITRTYGPIHFEDLDPRRFEDLVRELIYDYKDWQNIEATGRNGKDGGLDIRAYDKVKITSLPDPINDSNEIEEMHPMDGNVWVVQCKREKVIGPKKLGDYLSEIDKNNPPYGYIFAASANFSKDSYDIFREKLRAKGVMEFYLWGKPELEDMLHMPKNDRILFTFFGISLVSKRKSRSTEIRFGVNNKNKLYRILGDDVGVHSPILVRDSMDTKYPYKNEYLDFKKYPRWREYIASEHHPLGLILHMYKHFAYVNIEKKEFDFSSLVSLIYRDSDSEEEKEKQRETREMIEDFWDHLPKRNQAMYCRDGLIHYDEMLVVDDRGDNWHKFPHIFVDFQGDKGPFAGFFEYAEIEQGGYGNNTKTHGLKGWRRVNIFPKKFSKPKMGKIHKTKGIILDDQSFSMLKHGNGIFDRLYECDGRYGYLKQRDVVPIENKDDKDSTKYYLQITHVESCKAKEFLKNNGHQTFELENQIGRKIDPEETLNVYEFKRTYDFVVERKLNSTRSKKKVVSGKKQDV